LNKIERVSRAINQQEVDRPPFSFWYHFGLQHMPGRKHAEAEIDFYRAYDLDFLKVMNDYPYPLPAGLDVIESEEDWKRIEPLAGNHKCWAEQLTALSIISDSIGKEAFFIDTIFSPWTTARKLARSGGLLEARKRFPETILAALNNIATSLANYAREVLARGAAGIFLSLGAASFEVMSPEEYALWCRPFDLKILEAVRDASFNVLHIHGTKIHFDSLLDYPVQAINWSHFLTAPTLKDGKERSGKAVLGGINETEASNISAPEIAKQVSDTINQVGVRGLIITPGCSVATNTPERNLRAIKAAIERASITDAAPTREFGSL
jgi:uroporphyrinogen decarboxylase